MHRFKVISWNELIKEWNDCIGALATHLSNFRNSSAPAFCNCSSTASVAAHLSNTIRIVYRERSENRDAGECRGLGSNALSHWREGYSRERASKMRVIEVQLSLTFLRLRLVLRSTQRSRSCQNSNVIVSAQVHDRSVSAPQIIKITKKNHAITVKWDNFAQANGKETGI